MRRPKGRQAKFASSIESRNTGVLAAYEVRTSTHAVRTSSAEGLRAHMANGVRRLEQSRNSTCGAEELQTGESTESAVWKPPIGFALAALREPATRRCPCEPNCSPAPLSTAAFGRESVPQLEVPMQRAQPPSSVASSGGSSGGGVRGTSARMGRVGRTLSTVG